MDRALESPILSTYTCTLFFLLLLIGLNDCKNPATTTGPQSIGFQFHNIPPNRPGEIYQLWIEVPKQGIIAKNNRQPQHGYVNTVPISTFTANASGNIVGFDTTGMAKKLGLNYDLVVRAEVSVEKADSIGVAPSNDILIGDVTGTTNVGVAPLRATHVYVFGDSITTMAASATLASSPSTPQNAKGEVYLMSAISATTVAPGLIGAPELSAPWRYAMWSLDTIAGAPSYNFLGFFSTASGADSKSLNDHFPYPGGRTPDNISQPILDLTTGSGGILINVEPSIDGVNPTTPFPFTLFYGHISAGEVPFSPFALINVTSKLPTIDMTIDR
jgi:hypothetical protein